MIRTRAPEPAEWVPLCVGCRRTTHTEPMWRYEIYTCICGDCLHYMRQNISEFEDLLGRFLRGQ